MKPLLGIIALIAAAIGLSLFASHLHPGGDLPPDEIQAEKDKAKAEEEAKHKTDLKSAVDKSSGAFDAVKAGAVRVTLTFDGKGPMTLELYPAAAPKTVEHIVMLIKKDFYTGIKVHRLEDGSKGLKLIQFGDPESVKTEVANFDAQHIGAHASGTGTVPLEVKLPHVKYSVGLARSQQEDSGDGQMYINTDDNSSLDGNYCIFGRIIAGQDVLPTIKIGDKIKSFVLN